MPLKSFVSSKLFLIFLIVGVVSISLQIFLLQPIFHLGLAHDDWILITRYKLMGSNPLAEFFNFYKKVGPYLTTDGFYITSLYSLFHENYPNYYIINTLVKSFAILAVFPFVLLLFKSRLLAALTTLLYAASYSATGSFELASKGTNYLSATAMLIYFIVYYQVVNRYSHRWLWYLLLTLSFWIAILISPSRMFPLVFIPIGVEIFLLLSRGISYFKLSLIRLIVTYLPGILIILYIPEQISYSLFRKPEFLVRLAVGDWTVLMTPLSGLGYLLLPPKYLILRLGLPDLTNLLTYLVSTIPYLMMFFIVFTILHLLLIKRSWDYYMTSFILLYFILSIFVYFLTTNNPSEARTVIPTLTGGFLVIVSLLSLWRYFHMKIKNPILLALAAGPIISLWFITYTWYVANVHLSFRPVHSYLTIPALGICLWIAAVLVILFQTFSRRIGQLAVTIISLILLTIFIIDYQQINEYWQGRLSKGWDAHTQDTLFYQTGTILEKKGFQLSKPTFIYLDVSQDRKRTEVYDQGFISHIYYRIRLINNQIQDSCIVITAEDFNSLQQRLTINSSNRLVYNIPNYRCTSSRSHDFTDDRGPFIAEQVYAFRLKNLKVIDITEEILQKLE